MRHLGLENRGNGPLDEVMLDASARCIAGLFAPRPSEADARLAVLVLPEHGVSHGVGESNRDKRREVRNGEKSSMEAIDSG